MNRNQSRVDSATPSGRGRILALIAALSMMLAGLTGMFIAPAASAHTPTVNATCSAGLEVDLTNYKTQSGKTNHVTITIDGKVVKDKDFGSSFSYDSGQLSPANTSHTWSVVVNAWDDDKYDVNLSGTLTSCEVDLTMLMCHKDGQSGNYNYLSLPFNAVANHTLHSSDLPNGHGGHSGDIIKPIIVDGFTYYAGKNWTTQNQALFNNGCNKPVYTATKTVNGSGAYCVNGSNTTISWSGTATRTSEESQADANEEAQEAAEAAALADKATKTAGATQGQCPVYTATKTAGGSATYCLDGETGSYDYTGTATRTSTLSQGDADGKAQAAAEAAAEADKNSKLPESAKFGTCEEFTSTKTTSGSGEYCTDGESGTISWSSTATRTSTVSQEAADLAAQGAADAAALADKNDKTSGSTEGQCPVYTSTKTVDGSVDYCLNGEDGSYSYTGTGTGTSSKSQSAADEDALKAANEAADADKASKLPEGAVEGECNVFTAERTVDGSGTYCRASQTLTISWSGTGTGKSTLSQDAADADALANATQAANEDKGEKTAGATPGTCAAPQPFTANAVSSRSLDICYANETTSLTVTGSGFGESTASQEAAQASADAGALADRDRKMTAELDKYPGYTEGACAETPVPVSDPEPGTIPVEDPTPVDVPEKGTIPTEDEPTPVDVPETGTIPTAVPAGGGSSAPDQHTPLAAWLLTLGALGVVGSTIRLVAARN